MKKKQSKMINKEMIKRKNLFANFGGSYQSYIKNSKDYLPNLLVMINNFEFLYYFLQVNFYFYLNI